jgi:hypothetical protein
VPALLSALPISVKGLENAAGAVASPKLNIPSTISEAATGAALEVTVKE